jgi:hypothetical protein
MVRFASTFLSHSWKQHAFVEEVARELVRRGVLAWIDANELPVGVDLDDELRKASAAQLTLTAFLSPESIASDWCREELEPRLAGATSGSTPNEDVSDAVLPVFLGNPLQLVNQSRALRSRWLTPDGARVRRLGIPAEDLSTADRAEIARRLANAHFLRLRTREAAQLVIVLDQRGKGRRAGLPPVPQNWLEQPWPGLVFRPDLGERSEAEVLHASAWDAVRDALTAAVADALGPRARREVYITGNAQLALAWLLGQQFDRSSGVKLVTHNQRRDEYLRIDFDDARFLLPLPKLPPSGITWDGPAPDATTTAVSMYIGHPNYARAVHAHRATTADTSPLAVRETGEIKTADDVIELARWVATAAEQRPITVYTGLPFHAVPLLAALLKHEVGRVTFMEWDREASAYRVCPLPT